jgi:hypothetical protein
LAAATSDEQSSDEVRVALVLGYQILMDVLLAALLRLEALADSDDWLADDTMKKLYKLDQVCLHKLGVPAVGPDPPDAPWSQGWSMALGMAGIGVAIGAEIALAATE